MDIPVSVIFVVLLIVTIAAYLSMVARSRRSMDRLRDVPDDLRRADDNQQPPFDGSAGMWPMT